jgi:hypothetical protein
MMHEGVEDRIEMLRVGAERALQLVVLKRHAKERGPDGVDVLLPADGDGDGGPAVGNGGDSRRCGCNGPRAHGRRLHLATSAPDRRGSNQGDSY